MSDAGVKRRSFAGVGGLWSTQESSDDLGSSEESNGAVGGGGGGGGVTPQFEAKVTVQERRRTQKSSGQFDATEPVERRLLLVGGRLLLCKKESVRSRVRAEQAWATRNVSDYVPMQRHKLRDESLAVLTGWRRRQFIVTFATHEEKQEFLDTLTTCRQSALANQPEICCRVVRGNCAAEVNAGRREMRLLVKPHETANELIRRCRQELGVDGDAFLRLHESAGEGHRLLGCEAVMALALYCANRQRRTCVLSASQCSLNDSGSGDLEDEAFRLSLHRAEACSSSTCGAKARRAQKTRESQSVRQSIKNWVNSNSRKSISAGQKSWPDSVDSCVGQHDEEFRVVGRPLQQLFPSGRVSRPITCLLAQLYRRGPAAKGVFRQPGAVYEKNEILRLLNAYELNSEDNLVGLDNYSEYCIADALKHLLRNIPDCLLIREMADEWLLAADAAESERPQRIRQLLSRLPPQHHHLLHMLMLTLRRIANEADVNQMTPQNIGTSLSFSVLSPELSSRLVDVGRETARLNSLIACMIDRFDSIWTDETANRVARDDFVWHVAGDETSSTESLCDAPAKLSLSSASKDSGLQLSDQQLDYRRQEPDKQYTSVPDKQYTSVPDKQYTSVPDKQYTSVPDKQHTSVPDKQHTTVPERQQPPPYDIVMLRQQPHQSRRSQLLTSAADETASPRRERPPVPARIRRRPASVGPSGRQTDQQQQLLYQQQQQQQQQQLLQLEQHPLLLGQQNRQRRQPSLERSSRHQQHQQQSQYTQQQNHRQPQQQQQQQQQPPPPLLPSTLCPAEPQRRFMRRSSSETRIGPSESDRRRFSNRHAPIRGLNVPGVAGAAGAAVSRSRPRTRMPQQLERRLAHQPESYV